MVQKMCPMLSASMEKGVQHCQRNQCQWWDGEDCVIKNLSIIKRILEKS